MQTISMMFNEKDIAFTGLPTLTTETTEYNTAYAIVRIPDEENRFQVLMLDLNYDPLDHADFKTLEEVETWLFQRGVQIEKNQAYKDFVEFTKYRRTEMSVNFEKAKAVYKNHQGEVEADIIRRADLVIKNGDFDSEFAFNTVFNDGMFYPFSDIDNPESKEYQTAIGENGNEDDEIFFLSMTWVLTLSRTGNPAYLPIIEKITDISVNGL